LQTPPDPFCSTLTARSSVIVRVLNMEPTDPMIEMPRQAGQSSRWHPKQRFDLVRR
jgi:hypothetical protein